MQFTLGDPKNAAHVAADLHCWAQYNTIYSGYAFAQHIFNDITGAISKSTTYYPPPPSSCLSFFPNLPQQPGNVKLTKANLSMKVISALKNYWAP